VEDALLGFAVVRRIGAVALGHGQDVLVIIRILWRSAGRVDAGYRDGWLAERTALRSSPRFQSAIG
jgi:hypothetical protein